MKLGCFMAKDGPSMHFKVVALPEMRLFDLEHDHGLIVKDL